ncbi:Pol polyprotein [Caligus rogercresseyi]|uniref:Pol polyprotein n=1 Tax=Caligus rogercresseyi TaxID=217165 RepID=A0A7T8KKV2_CALRO|nr:Pol polyprotein [Caligus rogercresseyi]
MVFTPSYNTKAKRGMEALWGLPPVECHYRTGLISYPSHPRLFSPSRRMHNFF